MERPGPRTESLLHSAASMRALEQALMRRHGLDALALMTLAGSRAFGRLRALWPEARLLSVFCGGGNNGGDGYVLATLARAAGLEVQLWRVGQAPSREPARTARGRYLEAGGSEQPWSSALPGVAADVVVDALFGIGLDRAPRAEFQQAIAAINAQARPVFSLDLPSGLDADRGATPGDCVQATVSLCLIAWKRGLFTGRGPDCCGQRLCDDLGLTSEPCEHDIEGGSAEASVVRLLGVDAAARRLSTRARDAHKGRYGHVLVIGGDAGMGGAVLIAAESALRSGAGRVTVATHPAHAGGLILHRPELMVQAVEGGADLARLLDRATVLAIGPGLGQGDWGRALLAQVLASGKAGVFDADALNLLAGRDITLPAGSVLTPHPLEAARLLGSEVAAVEADRFAAVRALSARFDASVVLKGAGSLIASADGRVFVCSAGNPGMATAGMGDLLTGLIAGLLAQGLAPADAAAAGVWVHASAADRVAARRGERGLIASDLFDWFGRQLNP
ncbi:MAG: NAD(P)H-hydrate dehydratase [Lysobacterales bacterium]